MIQTKKRQVSEVISSQGGVHLSVYIERKKCPDDMLQSLRASTDRAREILRKTMTEPEIAAFLRPLEQMDCLHESFTGNVGIFRKRNSMRIINLPSRVDDLCVVATSFHVKPLLRWLQSQLDFLLFIICRGSIRLVHGTEDDSRIVDLLRLPMAASRPDARVELAEIQKWTKRHLEENAPYLRYAKIVVAGPRTGADWIARVARKQGYHPQIMATDGYIENSLGAVQSIRRLLKHQMQGMAQQEIDRKFLDAMAERLTETNLAKIGYAAAAGRVSSLMIASDTHIFGRLDRQTGHITLTNHQQDHEDECVYDDIAQMVLRHGGEVHVVDRREIPNANLAIAIVERDVRKVKKMRIANSIAHAG